MRRNCHHRSVSLFGWGCLLLIGAHGGPALAACTITATNVAFGSVDVLPGATVDTTGSITMACTGGMPPGRIWRNCVSIDVGSAGDATSRQMTGPGPAMLRYDLYADAARTIRWGSWETGYATAGQTADVNHNSNLTVTVYARVLGSQPTVQPGSYSASFTANPFDRQRYDAGANACPTGSITASTSFIVTATVTSSCNVSASTLNFGSSGILASAIDATTTVGVQCSSTVPYTVALGGGNSGATDPTLRKMAKVSEQITYGLYRDAARTLPWGSTSGVNMVGGTGSGIQANVTVYGRVPAQSTPSPGVYNDSIVVTVTY